LLALNRSDLPHTAPAEFHKLPAEPDERFLLLPVAADDLLAHSAVFD
jgi:hypothetical protein